MIDDLLRALIRSKNAAADEVLVDALRIGTPTEQMIVLAALITRRSVAGLVGAVGLYGQLPPVVRAEMVANIKTFHAALREAGRSDQNGPRLGAIAMIADGKQGRLAYILADTLRDPNEAFAKAAAVALDSLARDVADAMRTLRDGSARGSDAEAPLGVIGDLDNDTAIDGDVAPDADATYRFVLENRPDIEAAIVRGFDLHRGVTQATLLSAALRLCDSATAPTLAALTNSRHAGQATMVRRAQQTPEADHIRAFLLAATHGSLRSLFGNAFSRLDQPAVLASLLSQTHWLKDHRLQSCMHQVKAGAWIGSDGTLAVDVARHGTLAGARTAAWIACSGLDETSQDSRFARLVEACGDDFAARLHVFRSIIAHRGREVPILEALRPFLRDSDERLVRLAARELIRRRPAELENTLLPLMTDAPESVRRVVGRAVGQRGFDQFWDRFDRMDATTRRNAGRAMIKLLPDAINRLARRLAAGTVEARVKALQITRELDLVGPLKANVLPLCAHANARVRSKAVVALGDIGVAAVDVLIERVASDPDPRVRANAVEVMERRAASAEPVAVAPPVDSADASAAIHTPPPAGARFVPLLIERGQHGANRERANAIKALHQMKVGVAAGQLLQMLRDPRPEHRVSALWALRKIGWWRMLTEVARLAREDESVKVRQYAVSVLQAASLELPPAVKLAG